jgi:hypothetical protein
MTDIDPEILNDDFAFEFYRTECVRDVQAKLIEWSDELIRQKNSFSLAHNFFPGYNTNDPIVNKAIQNGYEHKVIYCGITHIAICLARVQHRAVKGEHYSPPEEIKFRYERGLQQLNEIIDKLFRKQSLAILIHEIRILDYSKDESIESIADLTIDKVTVLAEDENLLKFWRDKVPGIFRQGWR